LLSPSCFTSLFFFSLSLSYCQLCTCRHWDCTTLKNFCIAWGEAECCTRVLKGGTISMPTGRHVVDNFISCLKKNPVFQWIFLSFLERIHTCGLIYHNLGEIGCILTKSRWVGWVRRAMFKKKKICCKILLYRKNTGLTWNNLTLQFSTRNVGKIWKLQFFYFSKWNLVIVSCEKKILALRKKIAMHILL
jgi:hypothetical protein